MNQLRRAKQINILNHLVEGTSVRSTVRLTHTHADTILRLMVKAGNLCDTFLDLKIGNLRPEHWEIDEMWTFCRKKERHLTAAEQAEGIWGDQYLFLAIGQKTKLIPYYLVGKRNEANAKMFMTDLAFRFRLSPYLKHRLSTDGFSPYLDAVKAAFKGTVDYGMLVKNYKGGEAFAVRQVICGYFGKDKVCTSHMERGNLTIRTFMRRFTRRALGFSKKLRNLKLAVALQVAHYNYCWKHSTIKTTPAVAAGLADRQWDLEQLLEQIGLLPPDPYR